jgi:hypothetical protein
VLDALGFFSCSVGPAKLDADARVFMHDRSREQELQGLRRSELSTTVGSKAVDRL